MAKLNDIEPVDLQEEEIGVARDLKKDKFSFSKKFFYIIIIVFLVVGSFWASFYIGRAILSSSRSITESDFEILDKQFLKANETKSGLNSSTTIETVNLVNTNETKEIVTAEVKSDNLQTMEVSTTSNINNPFYSQNSKETKEEVGKVENKQAKNQLKPKSNITQRKEIVPRERIIKEKIATQSSQTLYLVRSRFFNTRAEADELSIKMKNAGIENFVKVLPDGKYFVQLGLFKNRVNAENLLSEVIIKNFDAQIVEKN